MLIPRIFVRKALYPAPDVAVQDPPHDLYEIVLAPADSESIVGWWYHGPQSRGPSPVLLFLHGNGENIETLKRTGVYERLQQQRISYLAIDYPGYGRSSGSASEAAVVNACERSLAWLTQKYPDSPVIICGWSLGAAAALVTAARNRGTIAGIILISGWANLIDIAAQFYPRWLARLALANQYPSEQLLATLEKPALIIHGEQDSLIPVQQGKRLVRAAGEHATWIPIEETGHNTILEHPRLWEAIGRFLARFKGQQEKP